ncbi:uncharacterized protein LOC111986047 [Quercus suber]|uniref:uncharacterized protein LOC111986047 n=1 Tax=Quercus suber TaxID=58331 RepID=UPI0032E05727
MATTNDVQGEEPPTTALERQVQTLTAAVEHLTKQNHDLEEQLHQKNATPNYQQEDQEGTSAARKNQEKPEGSHTLSRPERQNLSMPSLMDATPPHIVTKMYKKFTAYLMSIKQQEDETLSAYITCFNKEALSINKANDKILVAAFTNGLRKGKFLFSLYKNDPKTMSEVLYRATKYMNAEDALQAQEEKPRKRERQEEARQDQGSKRPRMGDRRDERCSKPPGGRTGALTFPGKLKGDPSKRSRDKYCRFHRDHGHDTTDCYDLKQQIEALIRQGKLQKFIRKERMDPPPQEQQPRRDNERPRSLFGDIRMIVGGTSTARTSKKAGSVSKIARRDSPIVRFSKEDARRLHHPHDNVLVVTLRVGEYNLHRVLVDNGSSVDILYYLVFQQMMIDRERLIPTNAPLVGFGGTRVFLLGAVTLLVTVCDYP